MSKLMDLNLTSGMEDVEELHMAEMTGLKKRMTKIGSCRSPEASLTGHLFPAMSSSQGDEEGG